MEDSEMMTDFEMTEIPEETSEETSIIQEVTEEMTTELLTSTETTFTTTTECLTFQKIEKVDIDMLNTFTYLGTFFMAFMILIVIFKGLYGLFKIFF